MINIDIWTHQYIEIESEKFEINDREGMVKFLESLLNKCYYAGETICLELVDVDTEKGKNLYTEVDRWK